MSDLVTHVMKEHGDTATCIGATATWMKSDLWNGHRRCVSAHISGMLQDNSCDCGLFMLCFMEFFSSFLPQRGLNAEAVDTPEFSGKELVI